MVGIDTRIVIIGLPQVSEQLHADIEQAIWITQAYVLTNTLMLSLIGRLGDIFGRVKIYTYGFAIFTVGSALTSLGMNSTEVIIFRGIQGIGAALVFTNSIAILTDSAPRQQLGLFLGINQIAFRAGALLGLTLSGLILSFLDWRALFYINIPIASSARCGQGGSSRKLHCWIKTEESTGQVLHCLRLVCFALWLA